MIVLVIHEGGNFHLTQSIFWKMKLKNSQLMPFSDLCIVDYHKTKQLDLHATQGDTPRAINLNWRHKKQSYQHYRMLSSPIASDARDFLTMSNEKIIQWLNWCRMPTPGRHACTYMCYDCPRTLSLLRPFTNASTASERTKWTTRVASREKQYSIISCGPGRDCS